MLECARRVLKIAVHQTGPVQEAARWLVHVRLPELSAAALDKACSEIEKAIPAELK